MFFLKTKLGQQRDNGLPASILLLRGAEGGRAQSSIHQKNLRGRSPEVEGDTSLLQAPQTGQRERLLRASRL